MHGFDVWILPLIVVCKWMQGTQLYITFGFVYSAWSGGNNWISIMSCFNFIWIIQIRSQNLDLIIISEVTLAFATCKLIPYLLWCGHSTRQSAFSCIFSGNQGPKLWSWRIYLQSATVSPSYDLRCKTVGLLVSKLSTSRPPRYWDSTNLFYAFLWLNFKLNGPKSSNHNTVLKSFAGMGKWVCQLESIWLWSTWEHLCRPWFGMAS